VASVYQRIVSFNFKIPSTRNVGEDEHEDWIECNKETKGGKKL
jgi:hypothetical protein